MVVEVLTVVNAGYPLLRGICNIPNRVGVLRKLDFGRDLGALELGQASRVGHRRGRIMCPREESPSHPERSGPWVIQIKFEAPKSFRVRDRGTQCGKSQTQQKRVKEQPPC